MSDEESFESFDGDFGEGEIKGSEGEWEGGGRRKGVKVDSVVLLLPPVSILSSRRTFHRHRPALERHLSSLLNSIR